MGSGHIDLCVSGRTNRRGRNLTLQSRVEQKTAHSHQQVSIEGNLKHLVVAMFANIQNSLDTQQHEQDVCQRVHNLCGVRRGIVILLIRQRQCLLEPKIRMGRRGDIPLHTNSRSMSPDSNNQPWTADREKRENEATAPPFLSFRAMNLGSLHGLL